MPARTPPIWCADLAIFVDPCALGAGCTNQGDRYPRENELWDAAGNTVKLAGAANEVLAFQLVIEKRAGKLVGLGLEGADGLELDLCQNIAVPIETRWIDDPVVPVDSGAVADSVAAISKKAPRFKGRRRQSFTVELYIPKGTASGARSLALVVESGGTKTRLAVALNVYDFELPDGNKCIADINNYSRVAYAGGIDADTTSDGYLRTMNKYFRMSRDHRALFHLLPYSQSGKLSPGYAPTLTGRGKNRRVADWGPFDRQWAGLLDGSVFKGSRGGGQPIEYLYSPVNLIWPAHFENYGRPGFKVEYQGFIREMAEHFTRKGWTDTKLEIFFNHKARWKYFPWDMDEIYYDWDNDATLTFGKWATQAAADFPAVKFINRIDSSWIFDKSARTEMGDCIQLWVVNRHSHGGAPDEVELLGSKGQETWFYGGCGALAANDRLDNLKWPWIAWGRESQGFTWWNGTGWGTWEKPGAGGGHCFYAGDRFDVEGPLASLRLKVTRQGMQDHAYLTMLTEKTGSRAAADAILAETLNTSDREGWYQREEEAEGSGADASSVFKTGKPWNNAPLAAWNKSRARLAAAIEQA